MDAECLQTTRAAPLFENPHSVVICAKALRLVSPGSDEILEDDYSVVNKLPSPTTTDADDLMIADGLLIRYPMSWFDG